MSIELKINSKKEKDIVIVNPIGELDDYNAPQLNDLFTDLIEKSQEKKLIVNMEETTYVDSVGLGTIAIAAKKVIKLNGKLNIVCTKTQILKLLNTSGMMNMLKGSIGIFETVDQAKKAF